MNSPHTRHEKAVRRSVVNEMAIERQLAAMTTTKAAGARTVENLERQLRNARELVEQAVAAERLKEDQNQHFFDGFGDGKRYVTHRHTPAPCPAIPASGPRSSYSSR